ncbi:MAG: tyrosine--tRNA ligase [Mycoplasma sp.]|nr:tyrosine--tRNA ligase [Mycoplasma sp.]
MTKIEKLISDLKKRGIINNITNEEKIKNLKEGDGIYIGFDPTAESLHLGNYIPITILRRFSKAGLKAYGVLGGATGMIGDPSFKENERQLLDKETLERNKKAIKQQLEAFGLEVIDNYEFYKDMNILDFLRDIGKHINVNYMINKESIATRLETGISFTEFTYTILQGYDFSYLYKNKNIKIQAGGSDQWGNITTGLELIRKFYGENDALGITLNLLLDSNGKKFGKSVGGAIWLDRFKTSPYSLYQYFINQNDNDVEKLLNWYTFLEDEEIEKIMFYHKKDPKKKLAQKMLALEVAQNIHGKTQARNAKEITEILFESTKPITEITMEQLELILNDLPLYDNQQQKRKLIDLLIDSKICSSRREVREMLANGSISIDNEIKKDENEEVFPRYFEYKYMIVKKGKRNFYIIKF